MRNNSFIICLLLTGLLAGCSENGEMSSESMDAESGKEMDYWVAPMDANYRRDKPGKSPMGMDLVPVYRETPAETKEQKIAYWVAPMDAN